MRYEEYTTMNGTVIQITIEHDPEDMMSGALDSDEIDCYLQSYNDQDVLSQKAYHHICFRRTQF